MNSSHAFDLCEQLLNLLCLRIETRGKLNLLNLNIHCEDFYARLLNLLWGYSLKNINAEIQNAEGIDLVDSAACLLLQVSSTATKAKVTSSLAKDLSSYTGFAFKFVSISKDATHLRGHSYDNPHNLVFDSAKDIHDVPSILKVILHMDVTEQRAIHDFLQVQLELEFTPKFEESHLANIVRLLADQGLHDLGKNSATVPFNIDEKVSQNKLDIASSYIDDYKIHHHQLESIYRQYDEEGKNKSHFVLQSLKSMYLKLSKSYSGDDLYFRIIEDVAKAIRKSSNYATLPADELESYAHVIAVDAFLRCKIFKEPAVANASA